MRTAPFGVRCRAPGDAGGHLELERGEEALGDGITPAVSPLVEPARSQIDDLLLALLPAYQHVVPQGSELIWHFSDLQPAKNILILVRKTPLDGHTLQHCGIHLPWHPS